MRPVETIVRKEWSETIRNREITLTFFIMAAFLFALPLLIGFVLPRFLGDAMLSDPDVKPVTDMLSQALPGFGALTPIQQFQVFMVRQFMPLFLLLPIMGAMTIATYSIIGEKTSRSLEALLATPTSTRDLLLGKSLAAMAPAVLATWLVFGVFALLVVVLGGARVAAYAFDLAAVLLILLITPLAAFLALGIGVIVSSRVSDARSAQQVGALLVLPVVGLILAQSTGLFLLGTLFVLIGAVALLALDALVLWLGVRLFRRETILTRWK